LGTKTLAEPAPAVNSTKASHTSKAEEAQLPHAGMNKWFAMNALEIN
jgi:hypothetical protein